MMLFSLPVFLLMSGAAILGFMIAWIWIRNQIDQMDKKLFQQQEQFLQVQRNYQDLLDHSNSQQGEKEKLIQKVDDQQIQLANFRVANKQLEEDKDYLTREFHHLRQKSTKALQLPRQITGELASMKTRIDELNQERENWREKYMIIRDANDEHLAKLSALSKDDETPEAPIEKPEYLAEKGKIDWREEFQQMQLDLNQKIQEYQEANLRLRQEYEEMKDLYLSQKELFPKDLTGTKPKTSHLRTNKNNDPSDKGSKE